MHDWTDRPDIVMSLPVRSLSSLHWNRADFDLDCYTFLFEPNPNWSAFYAPGPEIEQYIQRTVKKWNLDRNVQFKSRVLETIWDDNEGKWKIQVDQAGTIKHDEADILVNATGFLRLDSDLMLPST